MSTPFIGKREFFPGIGRIPFEGLGSDNALAFKHYDANKKIGGKTMAEHLRFAVCYWHSFCNAGHECVVTAWSLRKSSMRRRRALRQSARPSCRR